MNATGTHTTGTDANTTNRPFRVLGIQQIAIGGLDKDALSGLWTGLLGVDKVGDYVSESENVDEDILRLGSGPHAVEIDLMQPLDPERAPKVHVPTLNHVGLWIDDLAACVEWLSGEGMRFTPGGIRKGAAGHDVCFLHPKGNDDTPRSGEGVLIELIQAPDDVDPSARRSPTLRMRSPFLRPVSGLSRRAYPLISRRTSSAVV